MSGDIIKSFLVGLGWDIDEAGLAKFNKSIASATVRVTALAGAVEAAAAGVVFGVSEISESFEKMGYEYRIIAPAINKALILRRELLKAYSTAGVNITKVIQSSVRLNMSLAKTKFAFKALYDSVGSRFFELITKQSDLFREKLYKNMPKLQNILEHMIKFVFKAFEVVTTLGIRLFEILTHVYDFFVKLDEKTGGWSTVILGAIAAWRLLNLAFLATPLGMLIAGLTALLALWDDFKTFKEGGKSLIDWGSEFTKTLVGLATAIAGVAAAFYAWRIVSSVIALIQSLNAALSIMDVLVLVLEAPLWAIVAAIGAITAALTLADQKWNIFGGHLAGFFGSIGGKVLDFLGGSNVAPNLQNNPGGIPGASPVGPHAQNSQTNQNVNQQTQINVMGSSDANAVGKAVAGEQGRVNFDMTRNMKGSVR